MELVARAPHLGLTDVPRHWLARSAAATHVANGVNLLFPAGERFFVRAVRHYLPQLERDGHTELAARVRGFFGQEGRHAQAHERFFQTMRDQGYEVDAFLAWYDRVAYGMIEKASPIALRLAVTVALEHYTAILAEDALAPDTSLLAHADPAMRQLLEWHAVEELEHKSVAFDVLAATHPSYALRMAGLVLGTACLAGFWMVAAKELFAQDGIPLREARAELRALRARADARPSSVAQRVFLRGIREYLRPGFHPDDKDHRALVARTIQRLEEEGVISPSRL